MRPDLGGGTSPPRAYVDQLVKTKKQRPVPRSLITIPSDQKTLLERDDSWIEHLQDGPNMKVNVPGYVLEHVKHAHISRIPPPCGQRPPTSSTSEPKNSGNNSSSKSVAPQDDDDKATEVSWSPSPSPEHRRDRPLDPESRRTVNGTNRTRLVSQEPDPLPSAQKASTSISSSDNKLSASSGSIPKFLTQAPASSIPAEDLLTSPVRQSTEVPTPRAPRNHTQFTTQTPARFFPPSSAGTEEEIPVVLPDALDADNTPPVNKIASRHKVVRDLDSTPSNGNGTPPCGQAVVIPGTLSQPTPPITRPVRHFIGTQDSNIDAPPCGQGNSVIQSTYPDIRMADAEADAAAELDKASVDTPQHEARPKMMRIRFNTSPVTQSSTVQVKNTPAMKSPNKRNGSSPKKNASSPTTRIESTFPTESATVENIKKPEPPTVNAPRTPTKTPPKSASKTSPQETIAAPKIVETPASKPVAPPHQSVKTDSDEQSASTSPATKTTSALESAATLFWNHPYEAFVRSYPEFKGSLGDFVRACLCLRALRRKRRLPVFLYDDFIRIFCDDYIRYVEGTDDEEVLGAMDWYVENVGAPAFQKSIVSGKNLGRVFRVHHSEYDCGQADLADDQHTESRMTSEMRSVGRDLSATVTTTSALRMNVTPPPPVHRKRRNSMMSSVENVPPEQRLEGYQYDEESPEFVRQSIGKRRRLSDESPRDSDVARGASGLMSAPQSAKSGVSYSRPSIISNSRKKRIIAESPRGEQGIQRRSESDVASPAQGLESATSEHPSKTMQTPASRTSNGTNARSVANITTDTKTPQRRPPAATEEAGSPVLSSMAPDWRAEFERPQNNGVLPPKGMSKPKTSAAPQPSTAMPPPRTRVSGANMTANDHIKAKRSTLPSGWKPSQPSRPSIAHPTAPSSPAPSVLTQASGIRKKPNRRKLVYKTRIESVQAEDGPPNGASSSAP